MDTSLANTIVSTGGAVIVGISGMFFVYSQLGKRLDDFGKRMDELRQDLRELSSEFHNFKNTVKLMDK